MEGSEGGAGGRRVAQTGEDEGESKEGRARTKFGRKRGRGAPDSERLEGDVRHRGGWDGSH